MAWEEGREQACGIRESLLADYVEGLLQQSERLKLEAHLSSCAGCREAVDAASEAGPLLRAVYEPADLPGYAFWTRLGAELRGAEREHGFWAGLERLAWRFSFGATVAVLALVLYLFGNVTPVEPVTAEAADVREIFPAPLSQQQDPAELLLTMGGNGNGR